MSAERSNRVNYSSSPATAAIISRGTALQPGIYTSAVDDERDAPSNVPQEINPDAGVFCPVLVGPVPFPRTTQPERYNPVFEERALTMLPPHVFLKSDMSTLSD
jgi:hypothetical protein